MVNALTDRQLTDQHDLAAAVGVFHRRGDRIAQHLHQARAAAVQVQAFLRGSHAETMHHRGHMIAEALRCAVDHILQSPPG